jgi:flagellar basal-body rod modification protein FlgD
MKSLEANKAAFANNIASITKTPESKDKYTQELTADEKAKKLQRDHFSLLATQLKNQDPTNPMDNSEMTQIVVAMTQLQQTVDMSKNIEKMREGFDRSVLNEGVGYIGKKVIFEGSSVQVEQGQGIFGFKLDEKDEDFSKVDLVIFDNKNEPKIRKTIDKNDLHQGTNLFRWDNDERARAGEKEILDDGQYRFNAVKRNSKGEAKSLTTYSYGKVDEFFLQEGKPSLSVNNQEVLLSRIERVGE